MLVLDFGRDVNFFFIEIAGWTGNSRIFLFIKARNEFADNNDHEKKKNFKI